jgi:two-component system sensor histidine kinase KdpD
VRHAFGRVFARKPSAWRAGLLMAPVAVLLCALIGDAIASSGKWIGLAAFLLAALLGAMAARVARTRAREAGERRHEADLAVEMARLLLRGGSLGESLPVAGARLAQVLELSSAAIHLESVPGDERTIAFELCEGPRRLGTLMIRADSSKATVRRLQQRVVPALEALLSAALERDALLGEVVETAALRQADVVKTAVLRAVSHDLRSPLTAISTAGEALALEGLSAQGHRELAAVILEETRRLARLVENLLDVSRLEAGAAAPRLEWTYVEELIRAALVDLAPNDEGFKLSLDSELPLVRVDSGQLERAFVNVLENARRHAGGQAVAVRARAVAATVEAGGGRIIVRVVDRGPGIRSADLERVFEPFYRAEPGGEHRGSGLGLAIARGFTEANGGTLHVESLPGQGATFVFELPVPAPSQSVPNATNPRAAMDAAADAAALLRSPAQTTRSTP